MAHPCPDCGGSLLRLQERLYYCGNSNLYYPMTRKGRLGYPLTEPPSDLIQQKEPPKKAAAKPDAAITSITATNMFKHSRFYRFCQHQYSELQPIEAIRQLRASDPTTKRIVLLDFINWLQS